MQHNPKQFAKGSEHGKMNQKVYLFKSNFKYGKFQHKHKKVYLKLLKSFIMEASMLPLSFDELNTKFKNFSAIKIGHK